MECCIFCQAKLFVSLQYLYLMQKRFSRKKHPEQKLKFQRYPQIYSDCVPLSILKMGLCEKVCSLFTYVSSSIRQSLKNQSDNSESEKPQCSTDISSIAFSVNDVDDNDVMFDSEDVTFPEYRLYSEVLTSNPFMTPCVFDTRERQARSEAHRSTLCHSMPVFFYSMTRGL